MLKLATMEYENFKSTIRLFSLKNHLIGNKAASIKNTGSRKPLIPDNDLSKIKLKYNVMVSILLSFCLNKEVFCEC